MLPSPKKARLLSYTTVLRPEAVSLLYEEACALKNFDVCVFSNKSEARGWGEIEAKGDG